MRLLDSGDEPDGHVFFVREQDVVQAALQKAFGGVAFGRVVEEVTGREHLRERVRLADVHAT